MQNCELLALELSRPLSPLVQRVPSLPSAALAQPEKVVEALRIAADSSDPPQVLTPTPSRASQALEALRQDLARQNPELTPKEPQDFHLEGETEAVLAEVEGSGPSTLEIVDLRGEGRAHAASDDLSASSAPRSRPAMSFRPEIHLIR